MQGLRGVRLSSRSGASGVTLPRSRSNAPHQSRWARDARPCAKSTSRQVPITGFTSSANGSTRPDLSRYLFSPTHPFLPYVAPQFPHISPFILVFYKDRGTSVMLSLLRCQGVRSVLEASLRSSSPPCMSHLIPLINVMASSNWTRRIRLVTAAPPSLATLQRVGSARRSWRRAQRRRQRRSR